MTRLFDIIASLVGILLLLPMGLIVALLIKLTSRGPVFFCQIRVGLNGKNFYIIKFRTMTPRANSNKGTFEPGDHSRVTSVGRILRNFKIDELPQLFNVLTGKMALVGPRPEIRKWVDLYPERWSRIHTIRPGITDPASLEFRHEEKLLQESTSPELLYRDEILPKKLDLYDAYVSHHSFWGNIRLLFRTVYVSIRG